MQSQVFSGARTVFKLGGLPVGYALGCGGTTGINYQPLEVLGHLETVEHVPVSYRVEMNANLARIAATSRLSSYPQFPGLRPDIEGQTTSPQIMPAFGTDGTAILTSGELTAVIQDIVTSTTLYTIQGVKCSQLSFEIQAGGMVSENATFVATIMNQGGENTGTIGT